MKPQKTYAYHDQTHLARWIKRLAVPYFLGLLLVMVINYYKLPYLNGVLAQLSNPEFDYLAAEDAFDQQFAMLYLLMIPFIIVWVAETLLIIRWIYRAAANTYALNIPIGYKPHWSVTGYLIPLVNFVLPYRTMQQIADNSAQAARHKTIPPKLLGAWWATWLASSLISIVSSRLERQSDKAIAAAIEYAGNALPVIPPEAIQQQIIVIYLDNTDYALSFICFCCLFGIIQRINQAQNTLAQQQRSLKP